MPDWLDKVGRVCLQPRTKNFECAGRELRLLQARFESRAPVEITERINADAKTPLGF